MDHFFSVLTGDEVSLPFQTKSGETIRIKPQGNDDTVELDDFTYIIPSDWRIIGTMNTIDKASLYEMSYASCDALHLFQLVSQKI